MRHWLRTLLAFTRPYFGTARSMSKTFAVSTHSGGASRSLWIDMRPDLRSRFSCARLVRIALALPSASILWSSDLSGAAVLGSEFVTGAIGRRVYISGRAGQG